ncbi:MAG: GerW family sporulation protein [Clostridia bacterium]|nr:GerW family sporulation protein [Clostridia bacterium]
MSNSIENLMDSTLSKLKEIVNADTIIGKPINAADGTVVIPVSKVSYGFASGGSDLCSDKTDKNLFGGGNGAGVNISPVAFLVISGANVKLLQIESFSSSLDRVISMAPDVIDKISKFLKKKKESQDSQISDSKRL